MTLMKTQERHKVPKLNKKDLNAITLSVLGELPALLIATVVVNIRYLGRKNSLAIAYLISGILCSIIFFDQ